jgi:hypothetical protein
MVFQSATNLNIHRHGDRSAGPQTLQVGSRRLGLGSDSESEPGNRPGATAAAAGSVGLVTRPVGAETVTAAGTRDSDFRVSDSAAAAPEYESRVPGRRP